MSNASAWSNFNNKEFSTPSRTLQVGVLCTLELLQLSDDSLLLSWEDYDPTVAGDQADFPIYKSTDGGVSSNKLSQIHDQVNGWGNRCRPFLLTLPRSFGGFSEGTVLLASASVPEDLSQAYIDLYAGKDQGITW